jgi:hypothetical protein
MINANDIHRVYEESPAGYWSVLKRRVSESPLTSLTVAAGAGLIAYGLLKPKPKKRNAFIGKAAKAIGVSKARSRGWPRTLFHCSALSRKSRGTD